ncbi:MAG: YggS family pyridoxal phosphate-dependent enzyme [Lachnospiraceae bacterium]|nr:YggS family pyridoxal phosphate-dependent enzyme [Lachnospiraceae bacterium]
MSIKNNLIEIEKNICLACERSKRNRNEVALVAVSKNNPPEKIKIAYDNGLRIFGENRVQELIAKIDLLPDDIEWHMIGHLQRNKVKYIVGRVSLIHSVDSFKLAETISKEAIKKGIIQDILIEINVSGEESKHGIASKEAYELVREVSYLPGVRIKGLMTIAPLSEDSEANRPHFAKLKHLSVDIPNKNIDNNNIGDLKVLSMGMTGDYAVAIEEGASLIRLGTGVFK